MSATSEIPVVDIVKDFIGKTQVVEFSEIDFFYSPPVFSAVYSIRTIKNNLKYVLKIISTHTYTEHDIRQQIKFSEYLRNTGISTARFIPVEDNQMCFTKNYNFGFGNLVAFLQTYVGEDILFIDEDSVGQIGSILGKMHFAAKKITFKTQKNNALLALENGKTEFRMIWPDFRLKNSNCSHLENIHHSSIKKLKSYCKLLPSGIVHGDLGLTSNITKNASRLNVIDFNLTGSCTFVLDFLITWYSSRYKNDFICLINSKTKVNKLRRQFFTSYFNEYQLSNSEKKVLSEMCKILNGIYISRFISAKLNDIDSNYVLENEFLEILAECYQEVDSYEKLEKLISLIEIEDPIRDLHPEGFVDFLGINLKEGQQLIGKIYSQPNDDTKSFDSIISDSYLSKEQQRLSNILVNRKLIRCICKCNDSSNKERIYLALCNRTLQNMEKLFLTLEDTSLLNHNMVQQLKTISSYFSTSFDDFKLNSLHMIGFKNKNSEYGLNFEWLLRKLKSDDDPTNYELLDNRDVISQLNRDELVKPYFATIYNRVNNLIKNNYVSFWLHAIDISSFITYKVYFRVKKEFHLNDYLKVKFPELAREIEKANLFEIKHQDLNVYGFAIGIQKFQERYVFSINKYYIEKD